MTKKDGKVGDDAKYAWTKDVRGLMSLGGVLMGTEAADTIFYRYSMCVCVCERERESVCVCTADA